MWSLDLPQGVKTLSGERTVSSPSGVRKAGYLHTKEWSWTLIFYHIQKLTLNWLKPKSKMYIIKLLEENS